MPRSKNSQRNAAAMAQKERQSTEQVTKSQSLTLVKNLVRVSISTVCHLRNIFPASCFQERSYAGMRIYQLDASSRDAASNETVVHNEQAYMLTQWIEFGVFEAIERRYLRRMEFIVVSHELELPRESYSFDLDYPDNGNDHMSFSGTKVTTVENTKGQLVKLIRSLIQFSNTLEEVPNERIINMKLWYFDELTPSDWEPKYFAAADPSDLSFRREGDHDNLRIRIGELRTPHHTLKVRFEGIDTTLDCGGDGDNTKEEQGSVEANDETESGDSETEGACTDRPTTRRSKPGNLLTCKAGQEEDDLEDEEGGEKETEFEEPAAPAVGRDISRLVSGRMTGLSVSANDQADAEVDEPRHHGSAMDAAKAWTIRQARPSITGLVAHLRIDRRQAREYMQRMVEEGLLTKDSNYRYHLVNPPLLDSVRHERRDSANCSGGNDTDHGNRSPSQASSSSDDSATQVPEIIPEQINAPSSMPPPPPLDRRGGGGGGTPEGRSRKGLNEFATPPVPSSTAQPGLQRVQEKIQQAKILSMGTKRVLDEEAALSDDDDRKQSDPIDVFNPPTGAMGSMSTLGYEVSLSQASSVARTAKCSLAREPLRQSGRKKLRLHDSQSSRTARD